MAEFTEIDAMKAVADALENLGDPERGRVLSWASAKYLSGSQAQPMLAGIANGSGESKVRKKGKSTKKTKLLPRMLKSLDLHPKDKVTASSFGISKQPTNVKQKCVVSVLYLRDITGVEKVSVDHVYTFFKVVSWPVPSNLPNTLQQAGTDGWLDTADSQDIKITTTGENLVEHDLPVSKSAAK